MRIQAAHRKFAELLLRQRDPRSRAWSGKLSSSALSTALAVTALDGGSPSDRALVQRGTRWLVENINSDGGWGDTPESVSNISTSLIARACVARASGRAGVDKTLRDSAAYIKSQSGGLSIKSAADTLRKIYGGDKTFAVPILMYLALCGQDERAWSHVPKLPFWAALLPRWCFRFFRLEVVSYALPALIAVGLCRHICAARSRGRRPWGVRIAPALMARLERLQPQHGGFLDAAPLTAFVVMALKKSGYGESSVVAKGLEFLRFSMRGDGSCPIDTNLRGWLTALAARALSDQLAKNPDEAALTAQWIMDRQHRNVHPFTGARPGGWAWTDLPGGVPDGDDTAAALTALFHLKDFAAVDSLSRAVRLALKWLINLQNRDGGVPTFCRGWGHLPFDQSCCDITAHVIEALALWRQYIIADEIEIFDDCLVGDLNRSLERMVGFLEKQQREDGSWLPRWFGHQRAQNNLNPVFGTARVLSGLRLLRAREQAGDHAFKDKLNAMLSCGQAFLIKEQKRDGGWSAGGESTVEESALAVAALAAGDPESRAAAARGAAWLADKLLNNEITASPIGLYFSVLWYHEQLYPLIWSTAALKAVISQKT